MSKEGKPKKIYVLYDDWDKYYHDGYFERKIQAQHEAKKTNNRFYCVTKSCKVVTFQEVLCPNPLR